MHDGSLDDGRTQEERIAAGDAPIGSVAFEGKHGRIDVPDWIDVRADVERPLQRYAIKVGVEYDESDRDDVLRAVGRDIPPGEEARPWQMAQLIRAMDAARKKYDERAE